MEPAPSFISNKQQKLRNPIRATKVAYMNPGPVSPNDPIADDLAAVVALRSLADQLEDSAVERALREGWSCIQIAEAAASRARPSTRSICSASLRSGSI